MKFISLLLIGALISWLALKNISQPGIPPYPGNYIVHTVLFRFADNATETQVSQLMAAVGTLKTKIPGIMEVAFGKNFSVRSKGFTHAVNISFQDSAALNIFYKHPDHQKLIQDYIKPIMANMIVVDYKNESK